MLVCSDAKVYKRQHKAPCADCPWARRSLPGWLGPYSVQKWIAIAHRDDAMPCRTKQARRIGSAQAWRSIAPMYASFLRILP